MSHFNEFNMKDAIHELLKTYKLDHPMLELKIKAIWDETMGAMISKKTTKLIFKNRIVHITVNSSVLRNELVMMKTELKEKLNEKLGGELIDEIQIN
jgi:hypothetical protein